MSRKESIVIVVVVGLLLFSCFLFYPCVARTSDTDMGYPSRMQLKHIATALQTYHEVHGSLPPAAVLGEDGKPLYSWRVLLLPLLDESKIYGDFRLNEPWDSSHNRHLHEITPSCYVHWTRPLDKGLTRYQVLVGPGTAFELPHSRWESISDGLDQTILVMESASPVFWSQPADLTFEPARPVIPLFSKSLRTERWLCRSYYHPGFNLALADGMVRFIPNDVDEQTLRALITRNGGEKVDMSKLGN